MNQTESSVFIASVGTATPPLSMNQSEAKKYLGKYCSDKLSERSISVMNKVLSHPSVMKRNFALDDPNDLFKEGRDDRMSRFVRWAVDLSAEAIDKALDQADLTRNNISGIVVNTCTGYICPGISTYLIEKLGLSKRTKVYDLVGGGCGGAVPNLDIAKAILNGNNDEGVILSVSVEICSATFQMGNNLSLIISNAIFGDGAAAAVISKKSTGMKLIDSASLCAPENREAVRFIHKNGELHNQISVRLPEMIGEAVINVIEDLLKRQSLKIEDINHWAIHAGGDKIISVVKDRLGLTEKQLEPSRKILSNYGNMSSPTVWFVVNEIMKNGFKKDALCMAITFGAGLSAHAFLLKKQ